MPRISPAYIRRVARRDPLLALLLGVCREESQAERELAWLRQELRDPRSVLRACRQRARLVPLQYVLGSQPFGALDVLCRPRVLIPRWETEEWCCELARRVQAERWSPPLRVVDLCTGTGCVALQMQHSVPGATVTAVDCSEDALELARRNAGRHALQRVRLVQRDVLRWRPDTAADLLLCNPPYIAPASFVRDTRAAVKLYEPRLALVGDKEFYANLVDTWLPHVRGFAYEVGDPGQCRYVVERVRADRSLAAQWAVGTRLDARGQPRVVYGYRDAEFARVFRGFGQLQLSPGSVHSSCN